MPRSRPAFYVALALLIVGGAIVMVAWVQWLILMAHGTDESGLGQGLIGVAGLVVGGSLALGWLGSALWAGRRGDREKET